MEENHPENANTENHPLFRFITLPRALLNQRKFALSQDDNVYSFPTNKFH